MSNGIVIAIIALIVFLALMFIGVPVPISMGIVGLAGFAILKSPTAALTMAISEITKNFSSYTMSVAPMFAMMGFAAYYSGLGSRMFKAAQAFLGHRRGGLAMATAVTCAFFGAICGSGPATMGTMGAVAYPEMKKRGYHPKVSCCTIAVGSSIAVLIPPSLTFVIYGNACDTSVGRLFVSGIIPGLLLTVLTILCIAIMGKVDPSCAPKSEKTSWNVRWKAIKEGGLIEVIIVFLLSIGGLFAGWFAPTEAGAVGSAGMLLICVVRRSMKWKDFVNVIYDTAKLAIMVYMILSCANIFSRFIAVTGLTAKAAAFIKGANLPGGGVVAIVLAFLFIMGMLTDVLSIVLLIIPVLFPILIDYYGYSTIWFGNITLLMLCIGGLSPPVGISIFITKGCIKDPDVTLRQIFSGCWYFIAAAFIVVILISVFPGLTTWLPTVVYG